MHKMSKESATFVAGLQSRLKQAELILNLLLDENKNKKHIT